MLLSWLTCAALLAAASAVDATPEEFLLLETQNTVLPHRLLQLLTETGQTQQRQRRLRQSPSFKPWSGKRSGTPVLAGNGPFTDEDEDQVSGWPEKRSSFKPWTGKRNDFKPWTGKRNAFKPWTGKRESFKPWTGKRQSFKPWTGKRDSFKPWTGKRESFKPWTGKRQSFKPWTGKRGAFKPWTGKRTDQECTESAEASGSQNSHPTDIVNVLKAMEDFANRMVTRGSSQPKDQPRHVVRERFKPWSGKRSTQSDEMIEDDEHIQF